MNLCTGTICSNTKNASILLPVKSIVSTKINLDKNKTWNVGIDQSSSCTGITVISTDNELIGLFDLYRDKNLDSAQFYRELKFFLMAILDGQKVAHLVYEKPIPNAKFRSAQAVLLELKGKLTDWLYEIPALEGAKVDSLLPQTWKSLVMNPTKGKNRSKIKKEIASDIVDIYPCLCDYFNNYLFKDYDSFDSCGIITGYLKYAYNELGMEQIHGSIEKTHNSLVLYFQADKNLSFAEAIAEKFGVWCQTDLVSKMQFLAYNMRYDLNTNVRMASSSGGNIITLLPSSAELTLKWKYGIDTSGSMNTYMVVYRKGELTTRECNALTTVFKWNEVVCGEK